ncbi:MAG TPA: cytochrome c3 family protein [Polyangia bacterium]|nr:cytochrome c3 family protein [Polyangia bacterium]
MAPVFQPWADAVFKIGLIGFALAIPGVFVVPMLYSRTPYNLNRHFPVVQPVQFDHRHHAQDDGIACLYCHEGAERAPYAGVPATEVCMGCHSQIWNTSPMLEPVRRSYFSGQPLRWNRVNKVPDFVFFNHAIHVRRARVACAECHGDVTAEPAVERARLFTMGWCLDCHRRRSVELPVEPPIATAVAAGVAGDRKLPPAAVGMRPATEGVSRIMNCTTCHR